MENIYYNRIQELRKLMAQKGWDAVIFTGSDPHSSEYPAERWKQVLWLTGFAGECGDIVVTMDHAGLWTDTRYFIAANKALPGTGCELHKTRVPEQVLIPEWLATKAFPKDKEHVVIAVDGLCQRVSAIQDIRNAFGPDWDEESLKIVSVPDLLSTLWTDRPAIPHTPIITIGEDLCGESRVARISRLQDFLEEQKCDGILLSALDEIAWTLNVRASDIEYNPLVISYLEVTLNSVKWFVRKDSYEADDTDTKDTFAEVEQDGVQVLPYDDVHVSVPQDLVDGTVKKLFVDPSTLNYSIYGSLDKSHVRTGTSPVGLWKSIKNPVEIQGMKDIHVEDGLQMEKFLYWVETSVKEGKKITEWDCSEYLDSLRAEIDGYRGDSFETISAYGQGASLPHYVTPRVNAPVLEPHGFYLCDSGGQYLTGTTDITRTIPLGPCTMLEKEDYTLVLKAHIGLETAVFPKGTGGCHLDILGRIPMWRMRRNFGHGTGHGVGFFLGVHEGPQEFRQNLNAWPFVPGIINTDEPGIYREGMHGVRHENQMLCVADEVNEFGEWYKFESLTVCHIDTAPVIVDMLDGYERDWLNEYNRRCYETHAPHLPEHIAAWLKEKCKPI